jgi:hypothetical protein
MCATVALLRAGSDVSACFSCGCGVWALAGLFFRRKEKTLRGNGQGAGVWASRLRRTLSQLRSRGHAILIETGSRTILLRSAGATAWQRVHRCQPNREKPHDGFPCWQHSAAVFEPAGQCGASDFLVWRLDAADLVSLTREIEPAGQFCGGVCVAVAILEFGDFPFTNENLQLVGEPGRASALIHGLIQQDTHWGCHGCHGTLVAICELHFCPQSPHTLTSTRPSAISLPNISTNASRNLVLD